MALKELKRYRKLGEAQEEKEVSSGCLLMDWRKKKKKSKTSYSDILLPIPGTLQVAEVGGTGLGQAQDHNLEEDILDGPMYIINSRNKQAKATAQVMNASNRQLSRLQTSERASNETESRQNTSQEDWNLIEGDDQLFDKNRAQKYEEKPQDQNEGSETYSKNNQYENIYKEYGEEIEETSELITGGENLTDRQFYKEESEYGSPKKFGEHKMDDSDNSKEPKIDQRRKESFTLESNCSKRSFVKKKTTSEKSKGNQEQSSDSQNPAKRSSTRNYDALGETEFSQSISQDPNKQQLELTEGDFQPVDDHKKVPHYPSEKNSISSRQNSLDKLKEKIKEKSQSISIKDLSFKSEQKSHLGQQYKAQNSTTVNSILQEHGPVVQKSMKKISVVPNLVPQETSKTASKNNSESALPNILSSSRRSSQVSIELERKIENESLPKIQSRQPTPDSLSRQASKSRPSSPSSHLERLNSISKKESWIPKPTNSKLHPIREKIPDSLLYSKPNLKLFKNSHSKNTSAGLSNSELQQSQIKEPSQSQLEPAVKETPNFNNSSKRALCSVLNPVRASPIKAIHKGSELQRSHFEGTSLSRQISLKRHLKHPHQNLAIQSLNHSRTLSKGTNSSQKGFLLHKHRPISSLNSSLVGNFADQSLPQSSSKKNYLFEDLQPATRDWGTGPSYKDGVVGDCSAKSSKSQDVGLDDLDDLDQAKKRRRSVVDSILMWLKYCSREVKLDIPAFTRLNNKGDNLKTQAKNSQEVVEKLLIQKESTPIAPPRNNHSSSTVKYLYKRCQHQVDSNKNLENNLKREEARLQATINRLAQENYEDKLSEALKQTTAQIASLREGITLDKKAIDKLKRDFKHQSNF